MLKANVVFFILSYFFLGMSDTWAIEKDSVNPTGDLIITDIQTEYHPLKSTDQVEPFLKKLSQNSNYTQVKYVISDSLSSDPELSGLKDSYHMETAPKKVPYIVKDDLLKEQAFHLAIVTSRIVVISGFAYVTILITDMPREVAYAYMGATAFGQLLLGVFNDLELRYIAHKLRVNVKEFFRKTNRSPLISIDLDSESTRPAQFIKWIYLELTFLMLVETTKAATSPNMDFSMLHILKDVFITGAITTYMQEPLDAINSTFTRRRFRALMDHITVQQMYRMKNIANVRTTTVSIYSTVLALITLNPQSYGAEFSQHASYFMLATGTAFHLIHLTYKNHWLDSLKKKSHKSRQCSLLFNASGS